MNRVYSVFSFRCPKQLLVMVDHVAAALEVNRSDLIIRSLHIFVCHVAARRNYVIPICNLLIPQLDDESRISV